MVVQLAESEEAAVRIRPDHYLHAGQQRLEEARRLHEAGRYAGAIYLSGAALECVMRAYRGRTHPHEAFEGRHDLRKLLKESGVLGFVGVNEGRALAAYIGDVWSRWKNNYRYISDERLRAEFRRLKLDRPFPRDSDWLKANSERTWNSAAEVVALGVRRWPSKTSS